MALDVNVFDKLRSFNDYAKAEEEFQQRKQSALLENKAKQLGLLGQIVGNSSVDQATYEQARAYAEKNGIDTSVLPNEFNPDVVSRLRFAGATPTAQLSAMLQQEQMNLRAGLATGNPTNFGFAGSQPQPVQLVNPDTQPSQPEIPTSRPKQPKISSKSDNQTYTPEQRSVLIDNIFNNPEQPTPTFNKLPNETIDAFNARIKNNPDAQAGLKKAEEVAKIEVSRSENYTKAQSALQGFKQQTSLVTSTIDKALDTIKNNSVATGYGQIFSSLPNTSSRQLNNYLSTIKANIGFDKLQSMRDNSPTGGALGQVSDMENKLLQAVNGALDPLQKDQLVENLTIIKSLYPQVLAEKERAFEQDYGNVQPIGDNPQPQPQTQSSPDDQNLPKIGSTMEGTDGTYLFNGGNPADPKSWKKVK